MWTRADTGDVLAFWQPRSPLGLRDCDARQITANIAGFFRVLLDWENRERKGMTADKIVGPDTNDQDK